MMVDVSEKATDPETSRHPGRLVIWRGLGVWRSEAVTIDFTATGLTASGTQVGVEPLPYRLDYRLDAPDDFVTQRLVLEAAGSGWTRRLDLRHDGKGHWTADTAAWGRPDLPAPGGDTRPLAGALDCDLGFSPLTNLMPIRRSGLDRRAGAADFLMTWVSVPDLAMFASAQRYEHLDVTEDGSTVRYVDRGRFTGFTAELRLDRDGVALVYPDLAEQVGAA